MSSAAVVAAAATGPLDSMERLEAERDAEDRLEVESAAEDEGSWSHQLMVEVGCQRQEYFKTMVTERCTPCTRRCIIEHGFHQVRKKLLPDSDQKCQVKMIMCVQQ